MKKTIFMIGMAGLIALGCSKNNDSDDIEVTTISEVLDLPATYYNYSNPDLPSHFRNGDVADTDNTPSSNFTTDEGATLGRVLFYDKSLSVNGTVACASCHIQGNGFTDPARLSIGFEGGSTGRNSMGLANARFYENGKFFWDERANTLEDQVLMPIQDDVEMGMTLDELVTKLQGKDYYGDLFSAAFGSAEVTSNRISLALSQFVRSMVSYQSKYDVALAAAGGDNRATFSSFNNMENMGKNLFFSNRTECSNCHETATFSGDRARNNGLDASNTDLGLGGVTGRAQDNGKFKVGSLRNIELTGPFMHDGRFETLRDVVEFYNSGIQNNSNLDERLRENNGAPKRMNLRMGEVMSIVAFLNTLTDPTFISDPKFSDPFKD
jgi:cytochrome c peroxidase